jgi:hypothetical protein
MPLYKIKFIQQYCRDKFVYSSVTLCLCTNKSGPFIHETEHETGSGTCNHPLFRFENIGRNRFLMSELNLIISYFALLVSNGD